MSIKQFIVMGSVAFSCVLLSACDRPVQEAKPTGQLHPNDFTRTGPAPDRPKVSRSKPAPTPPPAAAETSAPAPTTSISSPTTDAQLNEALAGAPPAGSPSTGATTGATADDTNGRPREALVMDSMVGQINGQPVYAHDIMESLGDDALRRMGATLPPVQFRQQVMQQFSLEINARIQNSLVLAEAERTLTSQEQLGLLHFQQVERDKLISENGGILRDTELAAQTKYGHSLQEELEVRRQQLLTSKFMRDKLFPKVYVDKRMIERYYNDHPEEFNPNPSVTVRLIIAKDNAKADQVDAALAQGTPFDEVATKHSDVFADKGGLVLDQSAMEGPMSEFNLLFSTPLNEAAQELKIGEHSARITVAAGHGWVMLQDLQGGEQRSLQEAWLELEERLQNQQLNNLSRKYYAELMKNGNFSDPNQMVLDLTDVAMTRYGQSR